MAAAAMTAQQILTFLFFAMAVSFDGLAAGMSYGMRQIRIALVPLLLVNMVSAFAVALSMIMGAWVSQWLSFSLARAIGGMIFIGLGCNLLWQARRSLKTEKPCKRKKSNFPALMHCIFTSDTSISLCKFTAIRLMQILIVQDF